MLEYGDDRLYQAKMKLLLDWNEFVPALPLKVEETTVLAQGDKLT